jgi:hypothetical protein
MTSFLKADYEKILISVWRGGLGERVVRELADNRAALTSRALQQRGLKKGWRALGLRLLWRVMVGRFALACGKPVSLRSAVMTGYGK